MMMAVLRYFLVSCFLSALIFAVQAEDDHCKLEGFDLTPLKSTFWAVPIQTADCPNNTECNVLFSLCLKSTQCPPDAFACLQQNGNSSALGGPVEIEVLKDDGFKLIYSRSEDNNIVNGLIVEFHCDSADKPELKSFPETTFTGKLKPHEISKLEHGFRVIAKYSIACKISSGMGPGAQFMIVLLVMALIYLCGGIAYNHVHGLRGEELIPHLWFWKNFAGYVVEGCLYCVRLITCQTSPGYTQNPDYGATSPSGVSPTGGPYENI